MKFDGFFSRITIDSAEKPPLSENSGHQKMINQAPIVRYMASVSENFFPNF
jgi:hypothetical protein